jgi:spermidine/putrescine transport system permease protein
MKMKTPKLVAALVAVFAVTATLFFTGCEKSDEEAAGRLSIYAWSEYVPQAVLDAFQEETGIRVSMETFSSNEEMLAKLMAGGGRYDLIQPSEYTVEALIEEGFLLPLDHAKIPNLVNLAPEFRAMTFDPNNEFSVPWMAGTVGIIVNRDMVEEEITTFDDVFQEQFRGRIVVLDDAREITSWALGSLGIEINDVTDENLEKAREVISRWLPMVRVFDSDSPKTPLLNGDVALGIVWSGEGALLLNEDDKFEWILPAEGAHMFVDSLAIPQNARNPDAAMQFMNFILRPEISAMISEDFPYLNPNLAARALLSEEALNNSASFPSPEEMANLQTFTDIGEQGAKIDEIVTSVKVQ